MYTKNQSAKTYRNAVLSVASSVSSIRSSPKNDPDQNYTLEFRDQHVENFAILSNITNMPCAVPVKTDHFALVLCHTGNCTKISGPFESDVKPKSLHFISPQYIHAYNNISSDLNMSMILFKKDFMAVSFIKETIVDQLTEINPAMAPYFELSDENYELFKKLFSDINKEFALANAFYLQVIKLLTLQFLYEMNRTCEECLLGSSRYLSRQYQQVASFKKLVDTKFLELKTVQQYAEKMNISAKHLSKIVRLQIGQSPLQLIHTRIELEAKYLLSSTPSSIKEIAYQLGFDTISHFSRFFKNYAGKNPSNWKNEL